MMFLETETDPCMECLRLCSCIHMTTAVFPLNIHSNLDEVFTNFQVTDQF